MYLIFSDASVPAVEQDGLRLNAFFFESQTQHLSKMIIFCFAIGIGCIHAIVYRMVVISKGVHQIHNSNSFNYAVRVSTVLVFYHLNFLGIIPNTTKKYII